MEEHCSLTGSLAPAPTALLYIHPGSTCLGLVPPSVGRALLFDSCQLAIKTIALTDVPTGQSSERDSPTGALSFQVTPSFIKLAIRTNQDSSANRSSKEKMSSFPVSQRRRHVPLGHVALTVAHSMLGRQLDCTGFISCSPRAKRICLQLPWAGFILFLSPEIVLLHLAPNQVLARLRGGLKDCPLKIQPAK